MKKCIKCEKDKDEDLFSIHPSSGNRRNVCRECVITRRKELQNKRIVLSEGTKPCSDCNKELPLSSYYKNKRHPDGRASFCKECQSERNKVNYLNNSEKIRAKTSEYYKKNKDILLNKANKRQSKRIKEDPKYKLIRNLRNRLYYSLKNHGWEKSVHLKEYVGCDIDTLKLYLESQFQDGMTWDNYGRWHIDHIIPLSSANNPEKLKELCHYKNLTPLWAKDNLKKKDKISVCWQKLQRDKHLEDDIKSGVPLNLKANEFSLQYEEFTNEHREFIEKYEWLGTIGFNVKWVFTARYNNLLGGVVIISEPNAYEFDIKLEALIQRGACASWTPKNLASRLIMFSCRWMSKNTEKRIFVAYSDPEAGEIGTVYQACNFDYLGATYGTDKYYQLPSGNIVSSRYFTRTSSMKKWAKELNIKWESEWSKANGFQNIKNIPESIKDALLDYAHSKKIGCKEIYKMFKGKYVLLLKNNKRENISKIWKSIPYPKR